MLGPNRLTLVEVSRMPIPETSANSASNAENREGKEKDMEGKDEGLGSIAIS